ncbi:MAG: hypothetical protein PHS54_06315 [Clostridia bacterium]|nr:hypothetical protein [Clostridia bacterium]
MTTLKDKIKDVVMEYEKDLPRDPKVLIEAIIEEIRDYISNSLE